MKIIEGLKKKKYVLIDGISHLVQTKDNGKILKRIVVPKSLQHEVIVWCHDNPTVGHLGIRKILEKLKS